MKNTIKTNQKQGFTLIETMLVLGITGLILIGALAGTYQSIARQRYNDSVRSYAEFLRRIYSEVAAPESLGSSGTTAGVGQSNTAVYGKAVIFGAGSGDNANLIYTATLVGSATPPTSTAGFVSELASVNLQFVCGQTSLGTVTQASSVESYRPLWDAAVDPIRYDGRAYTKGTLIIARAPTSGIIHTAFYPNQVYNLAVACQPTSSVHAVNSLNTSLRYDLSSNLYSTTKDVDFCLKSKDSNIVRDIRVAADGNNTSSVNTIDVDTGDSRCN